MKKLKINSTNLIRGFLFRKIKPGIIKFYWSYLVIFLTSSSHATVRTVPMPYNSITTALNSCISSDTILVQPGIYYENIVWVQVPGIKLLSAGDSSNTIIDGSKLDRVLSFIGTVIDSNTVIKGFKITNGLGFGYGGGIYVSEASPTFENLDITGNSIANDHANGAGLFCENADVRMRNTRLADNHIDSAIWGYGAGIYSSYSKLLLENVVIEGNSTQTDNWCYGVGIYATDTSNLTLINVKILNNNSKDSALWYYGGGVYLDDWSNCEMTNVLICGNVMGVGGNWFEGGGIYLRDSSSANLMNVTIAGNRKADSSAVSGSGIYVENSTLTVVNSILFNVSGNSEVLASGAISSVTYSDIRTIINGIGNIYYSPLFVSTNDYHLQPTSQCINAGTLIGAPLFDLDNKLRPFPAGGNIDIGAYEFIPVPSVVAETNSDLLLLRLYPNLANSFVNIIFTLNVEVDVQIYILDISGKVQATINQHATKGNFRHFLELNQLNLAQGVYIIRIVAGNKSGSARFIKL